MSAGRGQKVREALVSAAAEQFWLNGFGATSLADIGKASGVPVGNIYHHYRTKADLALAVADVFVAETQAMIGAIEASEPDARTRLALLVQRLNQTRRSRVENGCPIQRASRDFRRDAPKAAARAAEALTLIISFVARELVRTGLRPLAAMERARAAITEWQGGIALAHAFGDATVMAESFRRMEQALGLR